MKKKINLHFRRFEFKYPLPTATVDKIIPRLIDYMEIDEHVNDQDFYWVNSVYFDSPNLICFQDKVDGIGERKKYRVRFYEENPNKSPLFLEIKRKTDTIVIKDRISIKNFNFFNLPLSILLKKYSKNDKFIQEFFYDQKMFNLSPKALIAYKRIPFFASDNRNFRITIDYDIQTKPVRGFNFDTNDLYNVFPENCVLEVKFNGSVPGWFAKILREYSLTRKSFSKYQQSIERICEINKLLL